MQILRAKNLSWNTSILGAYTAIEASVKEKWDVFVKDHGGAAGALGGSENFDRTHSQFNDLEDIMNRKHIKDEVCRYLEIFIYISIHMYVYGYILMYI